MTHVSPHLFILGTPTFGKGSVQEVKPVGNNCALKITTALYYLPDDTSIHQKGITPDFIIKQKYPLAPDVKLLEKLHAPVHKKKLPRKRKHEDIQSQRIRALKKDYQVQCASNLILLLNLAQSTIPQEVATHDKALTWLHEHFACPQSIALQEI